MDHDKLMEIIDRMRSYCPVAVQDDADKFFAPIREAMVPAIVRDLTASELEDADDEIGQVIECPHCHAICDHAYVEDICNERNVNGLNEDGVLIIDGHYETSGYDDGDNGRLVCAACFKPFAIPATLEIDFE